MRKLKKLLAVASVAAMTLSLCACGGKKDDTYTVGICQLVQHEAHSMPQQRALRMLW